MVGDELLAPDTVALRWASRLLEDGSATLASKLFEARTARMLAGVEHIPPSGDKVLNAWQQ